LGSTEGTDSSIAATVFEEPALVIQADDCHHVGRSKAFEIKFLAELKCGFGVLQSVEFLDRPEITVAEDLFVLASLSSRGSFESFRSLCWFTIRLEGSCGAGSLLRTDGFEVRFVIVGAHQLEAAGK